MWNYFLNLDISDVFLPLISDRFVLQKPKKNPFVKQKGPESVICVELR